jgi:SAM-dependent methyltransferase
MRLPAVLSLAVLLLQVARPPDVPFVPSSPAVIDAMLRAAEVTASDIVYDLGCGDGRILIEAARRYGARGVGIDIDAGLIETARTAAAAAGVADKVTFRVGDLFAADVREATVVTLYLLPSMNARLAPMLRRQLRPGARVVSNSFDMGDWTPTARIPVDATAVFLWRIQ